MDQPWLRHYPPGVAAEIDASKCPSLVAILEQSFQTHRSKDAFVCMGKTLSYNDIDEASRAFAKFGRGRGGHPAKLNFGDCMAYAVSAVMRAPLLFKGGDFGLTDVMRHPASPGA